MSTPLTWMDIRATHLPRCGCIYCTHGPGAATGDFSNYLPEILDEPPVNVDAPYVSGIGTVGETLNCTMGNWNGEPTSYAYSWMSDAVTPVVGTGSSYVIADTDAGHVLTCIVTATNPIGSTDSPPSNEIEVPAAHSHRGRHHKGDS
jgi:hypothetical protein